MPMKQILIIAPPGRLQEGLQVLLATLPGAVVAVVADARAAAEQVRLRSPQLVVVAGGDAERTIRTLAISSGAARFLVLVNEAPEHAAVGGGAIAVVAEGTPPGRLLAVVRRLLAEASADQTEVKR